MAPRIDAVRRPRTPAPEPLLPPSDSGQEGKEEQMDNEPMAVVGAAEAEEIKSILKSSAMAAAAAEPQPKEVSFPDDEMPSTSTGKRGIGKKCTQKTSTGKKSSGETSTGRKSSDQPRLISPQTSIYLADLKDNVNEGNPMKKYTLQQQIGQGTFGTVFRGVDIATGGQVAIKKIFLGDQKHQSEKAVNVVTVLKRMRHPNIVRYIDSYLFNEELWLVMEYVEGCTLGNVTYKQVLEEEMIASISRECLKALDFLHSNRVIHRDIKSDNILLGMDGSVKLIGFGSCVWLLRWQTKQTSVHGTPFYMAPEMLRRDRYDAKVDIWALGMTALEMVDGSPEAQNKPPELESPRELSPVFHSFLHCCLNRKVKRRWTARKLLKHPFLEKSDSLTNMSPLINAARNSRAERFTTPSPEPLLAPSVSGQEGKEEQAEKEKVKAKPEGMKSGTNVTPEPLLAPSLSGQEGKEEQVDNEPVAVVGAAEPEAIKSDTTATPEPLLAPSDSGQENEEEEVKKEPVAVGEPKDVPPELETPRNPPPVFRSFLQPCLNGHVRPRWPTRLLLQAKWLQHPFLEKSDCLTKKSPLLDAARRFLTERVTTPAPEPLLAPSVSGQEGKEEQAEKENFKAKPEGMKSGTTPAPEPLLAPSLSEQEGKKEQADNKPVAVVGAAEPEEIKSDTTAAPEPLLAPSDSGQEVEEKEVEKEPLAVGKERPQGIKTILKRPGAGAARQPKKVTFANTEMPSTSTGKGNARKKSIPKKFTDRPPTLSPLTRLFLAELKGIVSEGNPMKKYTLQQQIGQGACGTVFRGVDIATGGQVAIKRIVVPNRKYERELVLTEVELLSSVRHPNIVRYIDSYLFNEELWLVMEYVEGCTLGDVISKQALEEEMIASISRECLKALDFLHSNRVIHRDIKSDNILLGMDGSVKLIDFGLCAWLHPWEKKRRSFIGTPFYMAPEMLTGDKYDAKVDIWALGITALQMADGPTQPKDMPPQLKTRRNLSPVFHSFLHCCLNQNAKHRWTARKLLQVKWLQHPFLEKSGSLTNMSPLLDAARRFLTERVTTPAPEPLLAPSVSGQEGKEEQAEKENIKAKPEGMKSILKSSAMAGVAAAPQFEEVTFANTEMPSTSTGKGDTRKESIPKKIMDRPPKLSPLTRLFLAQLKDNVSEGNPMKKYTLQQKIGQGACGTVFRGADIATGGQVAIKKIFVLDRKNIKELVVTEVVVLSYWRHPNVIRYIDSYVFNEELWLVMEYVEGCTLGDVISKQALEEEMIASISRECLKALDFLHSNRVIHRDIKSDNILLGMDGSVKLIDFGFCAWLQPWEKKRRSFIGTPFYMAPEMLRRDRYDAKVDIWALGITALEMVDGPTQPKDVPPQLETRRNLSPVFRSFLQSCLNRNAKRRWTARKLLKHQFLKKSKSLDEMAPLIDAVRRPRTPAPEPLLPPSVSGQEGKEEQVEKKVVKAKPEGVKSILKSSAMAGVAAEPQPKEVSLPNTEMPSTSTGKRGIGKKCTQKTSTGKKSSGETSTGRKSSDQPRLISSLTSIYLADLKGIVREENPAKKYTLQQQIGQGTFGTVFRGVDIATGGQVAIKKIFLRDRKNKRELVVTEVSLLSSVRHPNIIRYIDSYLFNEELWLVMEYVEGCTLGDVISKQALEEEMIASISRECLKALDFLHSNRVIHRDIKSDNILLGMDGSVKLIDFGLCAWLQPQRKTWRSFFATPFYMASEMLRRDRYDAKVDIWALGITALEMVDGPTQPKDVPPELETPRNLSPVFPSFLQPCLNGHVRPRWPTRLLLQAKWLQHPFLEKSDSLANMSPLLDAARSSRAERFTTPSPEPLLAPSVSGQEGKEEQAEKENVKAKPEGMKSGTNVTPEPLLAPSLSGQEGKEEQVDNEPVAVVGAAEPEAIKSDTTATPEPLLAPSDSGQENEEEEVEKEPVAVGEVMPEGMKALPKDVPPELETPRNPPPVFHSFLQSCLNGHVRPRWPTRLLLQAKWLQDTTAAPEPLLAPSDSGQEIEEEEVEKEPVAVGKVMPEGMKSILKRPGAGAARQPKKVTFANTEMPSTSTGKGNARKKSIPKKFTDRPPTLSPLTRLFLAELKGIVSEGNPAKKYTLQQQIGQGTFGTVFRGADIATGGQVAIKRIVVPNRKYERELVLTEVELLSSVRHPNIVRYIDSYLFNEELWLVMEYVEGCTLGDVISKQALEEEMIASISRECLKALDFLHSNRVIHRDIKSDNILLGMDGSVKLIDFGLCAWLQPQRKTWRSFFATPFYMASEMLRRDRYDAKVDIWALGITALEMVDGPTQPKDMPPELETPRNSPPVFRSFLQPCLNGHVRPRWPTRLLLQAKWLQHPFLEKSDSLANMSPLLDAARSSRAERFTTPSPEPLLAPSVSGQEGKEEQAEKEKVKAKPEGMKSGTNVTPEPLLAPSLSGQEGKEEQVDNEPVAVVGAAEPEAIKSDTTATPEPLLAPSDSGQENEEEEVEKEPVAVGEVMPEGMKALPKDMPPELETPRNPPPVFCSFLQPCLNGHVRPRWPTRLLLQAKWLQHPFLEKSDSLANMSPLLDAARSSRAERLTTPSPEPLLAPSLTGEEEKEEQVEKENVKAKPEGMKSILKSSAMAAAAAAPQPEEVSFPDMEMPPLAKEAQSKQ
ncbi:uncharacterized protein LOC116794030 [Chiroxiphia lanceolata]|uniref:uncharacterized protein LOC116794030 n=1 Tax=Chiroxiphia lanceolata TaxID=296741 RepID=UPI0013CEDDB2|nr:uncharacterized protein LOC116794030 [Chiroxiphia lanceolata]